MTKLLKTEKIRKQILVPLALTLAFLIAGGIYAIYFLQQHHINEDISSALDEVSEVFDLELDKEANLLQGMITFIEDDQELQAQWFAQDREGLLGAALPLFEEIKPKFRVTHFYFHDLGGVNFLRVHNPGRYNDTINRFTMQQAMRDNKTSYGIELGPLGTFTLRVVEPWRVAETIVGYIELGMEIEHLTPDLKTITKADFAFIINKDFLNQANWQEGLKMLGRTGNWDEFPEFVIIESTMGNLPKELTQYLKQMESCEETEHHSRRIRMSSNGRNYYCGFVALKDAGNQDVGDVIVIKDITGSIAALSSLKLIMAVCGSVTGFLLIISFSYLLKGIEGRLIDAREKLNAKIVQEKQTSRSLIENEKRLKKEIRQRVVAESELESRVSQLADAQKAALNMMEDTELAKTETEKVNRKLQEAVERANVMAREAVNASKSKSEFLANMSHEIRTPMNAVVGFSDLLSEEDLNEEQKSYVNNIVKGGQNLLRLIDDILDFSKIEAGKLKTEIIDCSTEKVLENVDLLMKPLAGEKGLEFGIFPCGDLPSMIRTDPSRLHQCLVNLVSNAIKFTEKGHVHINVSPITDGDELLIRFDVEDTGIGISADEQSRIFESFTQADGSTTRRYGGTGLGLTITKQLAELLGGKLKVSSKEKAGSVFSIILPTRIKTGSVELMEKQDVISADDQPHRKINQITLTGKILVAEDNEANFLLVQNMLEKMGLEIAVAHNGLEALAKVSEDTFDLVLMDMQMPKMNGYEATEAIRQKGMKIPIFALTANAMKNDEKRCLDAGCNEYISKPVNWQQLTSLIETYIRPEGCLTTGEIDDVASQIYELGELCNEGLSSVQEIDQEVPVYRDPASSRPNCWEIKKCGRQPGGDNVSRLGVCPAVDESVYDGVNGGKNAGRCCWKVAGTMCEGKVHGIYAKKLPTCLKCDFFKQVQDEQSRMFVQ